MALNTNQTPKEELIYAEEFAVAHVALVLSDLLENCNITQRQLAKQVGVSEGRISQILSADANLTVKTLARIGHVLGHRFCCGFQRIHEGKSLKQTYSEWKQLPKAHEIGTVFIRDGPPPPG